MGELHVTALTEDGRHLLLVGEHDGKRVEYRLELDDRLRAALRGDLGRVGQQSIRLESQLRPREIQARIRAGEPLDVVARTAGVPVDRIEPYAAPVLTERAAMADRARRAPVAVHGGEWAGVPAEEIVGAHVIAEHGEPGTAGWDAWRREDGSWLVSVTWPVGQTDRTRSALFLWQPAGRRLTPADAGADALVGTRPARLAATGEPAADDEGSTPRSPVEPVRPVAEASTEPSIPALEPSLGPAPRPAPEPAAGSAPHSPTPDPTGQPVGRGRGRRRASVPAWDDIMLGAAAPDSEPDPGGSRRPGPGPGPDGTIPADT